MPHAVFFFASLSSTGSHCSSVPLEQLGKASKITCFTSLTIRLSVEDWHMTTLHNRVYFIRVTRLYPAYLKCWCQPYHWMDSVFNAFWAIQRLIRSWKKDLWDPISYGFQSGNWTEVLSHLTLSRQFLLWKTRLIGHEPSSHSLFNLKGQLPTSSGQLEDVKWYWITKPVSGWMLDFIEFD